MGSSSSAPGHELWPEPAQQHILWKFEQFLQYQPKFKSAHELPHTKVLTMMQLTVQEHRSSV